MPSPRVKMNPATLITTSASAPQRTQRFHGAGACKPYSSIGRATSGWVEGDVSVSIRQLFLRKDGPAAAERFVEADQVGGHLAVADRERILERDELAIRIEHRLEIDEPGVVLDQRELRGAPRAFGSEQQRLVPALFVAPRSQRVLDFFVSREHGPLVRRQRLLDQRILRIHVLAQ